MSSRAIAGDLSNRQESNKCHPEEHRDEPSPAEGRVSSLTVARCRPKAGADIAEGSSDLPLVSFSSDEDIYK